MLHYISPPWDWKGSFPQDIQRMWHIQRASRGVPYNGKLTDTLDTIRYQFCEKVASSSTYSDTGLTSNISQSITSYVCTCKCKNGKDLLTDLIQWNGDGRNVMRRLCQIQTTLPPAPEKLLWVIKCNCQGDCSTLRCTCKKSNIECASHTAEDLAALQMHCDEGDIVRTYFNWFVWVSTWSVVRLCDHRNSCQWYYVSFFCYKEQLQINIINKKRFWWGILTGQFLYFPFMEFLELFFCYSGHIEDIKSAEFCLVAISISQGTSNKYTKSSKKGQRAYLVGS